MSQDQASHTSSVPRFFRRMAGVMDADVPMPAANVSEPALPSPAISEERYVSQLEPTQSPNARRPAPQYNTYFSASDTETIYIDSQLDESMEGSGSQKENAPLRGNNGLLNVAGEHEAQSGASPNASYGGNKGIAERYAGSMLPPSPRAPSTPPPAKGKPNRAVSFLSPYSNNPTRDVARSHTYPTHSTPARQRSASPPSQDSFGGPVPIEDPAREYERHASPFSKTSSQVFPVSPDSDFSSHWSSLYGPRSTAMPTDKTPLSPAGPVRGRGATNGFRSASRYKTKSPEPDATQSSSSSQVTRSQIEDSTRRNFFGQMDTGPKESTLAAVFGQSQELNPFPHSQNSNRSSIPGLPGMDDAEELVPTQPATQIETQLATQLEPTQLEPTVLEPTLLEPFPLEPTQLEAPLMEPIQLKTPPPEGLGSYPVSEPLAPGMEKPKTLSRPQKYIVELEQNDTLPAPIQVSNFAMRPSEHGEDQADSSALGEAEPDVARTSGASTPAASSSPIATTHTSGRAYLIRRYRAGSPIPILPNAREGEVRQKRKRVETAPGRLDRQTASPLAPISPPRKRARQYSDPGEIIPPSDFGDTDDDGQKPRQPTVSSKATAAERTPIQSSRPPLSVGHVSETEDEGAGEAGVDQQDTEAEDDDDVPLSKSNVTRKARRQVDVFKDQDAMPSSSPDIPLALTVTNGRRHLPNESRDNSEDRRSGPQSPENFTQSKGKQRVTEHEEADYFSPTTGSARAKQATKATASKLRAKDKPTSPILSRQGTVKSPTITPKTTPKRLRNRSDRGSKHIAKRAVYSRSEKARQRSTSKSTRSESGTPGLPENDDEGATEPATTELAEDDLLGESEVESPGYLPVPIPGPSRMQRRRRTRSTMSSTSTFSTMNGRTPRVNTGATPIRSISMEEIKTPFIRVLALYNSSYYPGTIIHREGTLYRVVYDDNYVESVNLSDLRRLELHQGDDVRWGQGKWEHGKVKEFIDKPPVANVRQYSLKVAESRNGKMIEPEAAIFWVTKSNIKTWDDRKFELADLELIPSSVVAESPTTRANSNRMAKPSTQKDEFWSKAGFVITGSSQSADRARITRLIEEWGGRIFDEWTDVFSPMGNLHDDKVWVATQGDIVFDPASECERVYLLSDVPCRKPKYLMALALGIPCISFRWVEEQANSNALVSFGPFLLPAGTSKPSETGDSRLGNLSWGQLADLSWCESPQDLVSIRTARCAYRPFEGKCVLVVGNEYVPSTKGETSNLVCVPRILLAMGAALVVAVGPQSVNKARDLRHPQADPDQNFGSVVKFNYVILRKNGDFPKLEPRLKLAEGRKVEDWNWVTDCLIARRLFETAT